MKLIDLASKRFGRLTVVKRDYDMQKNRGGKNPYWQCECDCGNKVSVKGSHLREGRIQSCGCLRNEMLHKRSRKDMIAALAAHQKKLVEGTNLTMISNGKPKNNKSGVKGVYFDTNRKKWVAKLNIKGNNVLNKYFKNKQDAIDTRKEAEKKYFKPILEKYKNKI